MFKILRYLISFCLNKKIYDNILIMDWKNISKKRKAYILGLLTVIGILVWAFVSAGVITHNFNRSQLATGEDKQEALINGLILTETKEAEKYGIRLLVSGAKEPLPPAILKQIDQAVSATAENTQFILNLALNYGARQEIVHAVNALLQEGKKEIQPSDISQHLYQPSLPDPELIIRTSGEERLSNFLLWQAAYSEFYFTPVLWPDFDEAEFEKALSAYRTRKRRFGGL